MSNNVTDNKVGKITDSESTIKALKALLELVLVEGCLQRAKTISNALDLINRQKAEIDRISRLYLEALTINAIRADIISEQKAENERLKANLNIELENFATEYDNKIKAEAYKEFAERLKEKTKWLFSSVSINKEIDNLLKELGCNNES